MGFIEYIKETRGELHHVAWPTRAQTVVYTIIVIALSIFVSLYLGLFDYIFTGILSRSLQLLPHSSAPTTQQFPSSDANSGVTVTPIPAPSQTPAQPAENSGVPSFQ